MSDEIPRLASAESREEIIKTVIPLEYASLRLDAALVKMFPEYSRSRLQQWIKAGHVLLDNQQPRARDKVIGAETVELRIEPDMCNQDVIAQDIALDIVYEDRDILVINKAVGMVVHPAAGHADGTLQNGLLYYDDRLHEVPRSGIVHRLDKDTSGLMVVARNIRAHKQLVEQLQARTVHREYQAIVLGLMTAGNTIDLPIGRHGRDRKRMAVKPEGKEAITHYRVLDRYRGHTRVKVKLETGRTHQIRVHMAQIRHPLVGDQTYGGRLQIPAGTGGELKEMLRGFNRQALHAGKLGLIHPASGEEMSWKAGLPEDMKQLIAALQTDIEAAHTSDEDDIYEAYMGEYTDE
ncbi:Ribosomal large subunit pseudouridine synthase D [hydrothermal vent metagenome]|uniref:Ribosomal large subunit pseudouridine synthase D n=1 Tax=hydrothermal vent metagenome TaxID=652676 RepID=A0A3B0XGU3_9ZZZZ